MPKYNFVNIRPSIVRNLYCWKILPKITLIFSSKVRVAIAKLSPRVITEAPQCRRDVVVHTSVLTATL